MRRLAELELDSDHCIHTVRCVGRGDILYVATVGGKVHVWMETGDVTTPTCILEFRVLDTYSTIMQVYGLWYKSPTEVPDNFYHVGSVMVLRRGFFGWKFPIVRHVYVNVIERPAK